MNLTNILYIFWVRNNYDIIPTSPLILILALNYWNITFFNIMYSKQNLMIFIWILHHKFFQYNIIIVKMSNNKI